MSQSGYLFANRFEVIREVLLESDFMPVEIGNVSEDNFTAVSSGITLEQFFLPVKSIFITSKFGNRKHPISQSFKHHNGIDLRARFEDVFAIYDGTVSDVSYDKISGIYIKISHGLGVESVYCHLSDVSVYPGQKVAGGTVIATSGATGRVSGPHLHFALKIDGKYINPSFLFGK